MKTMHRTITARDTLPEPDGVPPPSLRATALQDQERGTGPASVAPSSFSPSRQVPGIVVYDRYTDGHRRDYFRVLQRTLGADVVTGEARMHWRRLLTARHLVCTTCDDYLESFTALCAARSLLGRRTVGLSIRAETAVRRRDFAGILKRGWLRALRGMPGAHFVTLMPMWTEPGLKRYASDWMYDLQLWDLPWLDAPDAPPAELVGELRRVADGRRVVVAIGHQRRVKGIHYFMELYADPEIRRRHLFVCVGPDWDLDTAEVERFRASGGLFLDREVRDEEILPLYGAADVIWACYHPDYDQSSGIFGRAVQLGQPTIVRSGSYLCTLQRGLGAPGWALPYDDVAGARAVLLGACARAEPLQPLEDRRCAAFLPALLGVPALAPRRTGWR